MSGYGIRARGYGVEARGYFVGTRGYGSLVILVSAQVPLSWSWLGLGLGGFGTELDNICLLGYIQCIFLAAKKQL